MAKKDHLQIPESERGEILATVSVDRAKVALQSGGYGKTLAIGIVGVVFGLLLALGARLSAGWIIVAIFGFILLLAAWRMWVASQQVAATDEQLIAYQVRSGGVLIPSNFFIPWDEISGATYEWRQAGGGVAVGVAGAVAKGAYDSAMASHSLDNAKRVITFALVDYPRTNKRSGGNHIGMLAGPFIGFPGTGVVNLSGTVDDAVFTTLLEVTQRELLARGKTFVKYDYDAESEAARAVRKAKKR